MGCSMFFPELCSPTMDKRSAAVNVLFRITIFVVKLDDFVYSQLYFFSVAQWEPSTLRGHPAHFPLVEWTVPSKMTKVHSLGIPNLNQPMANLAAMVKTPKGSERWSGKIRRGLKSD